MSASENELPNPHRDSSGNNNTDPLGRRAFALIAKLWTPRNVTNEPPAATVARFAQRLINRLTGKAYSVDELPFPELDADGNITINGAVFARNGGVAGTLDTLSLNDAGQLVVNNGEDIGNDLPVPQTFKTVAGSTDFSGAQNIAGVRSKMASFFIPASKAVVGTVYRITGGFETVFAAATNTPPYYLGFCPVPSNATGNAVGFLNGVVSKVQKIDRFTLLVELVDATGGDFNLQVNNTDLGSLNYGGASGNVSIASPQSPSASGSEDGPIGETCEIGLYYEAPATASAPACTVNFDFKIEEVG